MTDYRPEHGKTPVFEAGDESAVPCFGAGDWDTLNICPFWIYNSHMNKHEETSVKSVSIRIPVDGLEELHKVAKQHDRSLNGEVLTAIRDHLKKSQKEKREPWPSRLDRTHN
jgi:hypothetical protein